MKKHTIKLENKKAAKFDENVRANEIIKTLKKNVAEPVSKFAAKQEIS